jgi:hypothetical protein
MIPLYRNFICYVSQEKCAALCPVARHCSLKDVYNEIRYIPYTTSCPRSYLASIKTLASTFIILKDLNRLNFFN